jgi:hypothetical protein
MIGTPFEIEEMYRGILRYLLSNQLPIILSGSRT